MLVSYRAPGLGDAMAAATAALARCADLARAAGCRPAFIYLAGARGAVQHAMEELARTGPLNGGDADGDFTVECIGRSEVIRSGALADTVRRCGLPDGALGTARALLAGPDTLGGIWLRESGEMPGVMVRGRLSRDEVGVAFGDDPDCELEAWEAARPDLGRDLLLSGVDLRGRPVAAAAMEITLASGSWVHLGTGGRWFADPATAAAVVRLLGGQPRLGRDQHLRMGTCLDRATLLRIEALGWRHWPMPSLDPPGGRDEPGSERPPPPPSR